MRKCREKLRGFGFDLRSNAASLRLGILLGNSDCTSEIGAEGGVGFSDETVKYIILFLCFFWRFGSFTKWQPWIWITSRWSTGGEEFAKFAKFALGPMPFHWENLQVWGRVEVFVEGLLLQENELRLSEISEGLQWQDQKKRADRKSVV